MAVHTALLRLQTEGEGQIIDLTPGLESALRSAGVDDGVVTVFVTGSTAAITTMEYEPGGVQDLQEALERLVPQAPPEGGDYAHNTRNHDDNAHAHLRASLVGPSLSIPLVRGSLVLGTWQQVVLIDFDDRPRERVGPRPDRVLRLLHSALLRNSAAPQVPSRTGRGALYSAARSGSPRAARQALRERNPLPPQGATVFENSTACAPDGRLRPIVCVRPGSIRRRLRSRGGLRNQEVPAVPRRGARAPLHVYEQPLCGALTALREQFFTESLILAQDERWRRA